MFFLIFQCYIRLRDIRNIRIDLNSKSAKNFINSPFIFVFVIYTQLSCRIENYLLCNEEARVFEEIM